jgi:hypothetical protein
MPAFDTPEARRGAALPARRLRRWRLGPGLFGWLAVVCAAVAVLLLVLGLVLLCCLSK